MELGTIIALAVVAQCEMNSMESIKDHEDCFHMEHPREQLVLNQQVASENLACRSCLYSLMVKSVVSKTSVSSSNLDGGENFKKENWLAVEKRKT